jgi:hypothetical protein
MSLFRNLFQTNRNHFILSFLSIVGFSLFHIWADLPPRHELLFVTSDAVTYYEVAQWITTGEVTESLSTRPILYPFLLMLILNLGGNSALFYLQALFWLFAVNFCFASLWNLSNNKTLAWIGALIFACNLSLIALTAHAITEVFTVFMLSVLVFILAKFRKEYTQVTFGLRIIALFVVLTLIKPVFFLPTLFLIFLSLWMYRKVFLDSIKSLVFLAIIVLPLLGQMTLVYSKFDEFKVSTISSKTFSRYFLTQGIAQLEGLDRVAALEKAEHFSKAEKWAYISENRPVFVGLFFKNIKENIKGAPIYLKYPNGLNGQKSELFMKHFNHVSYIFHIVMIFVGLITLVVMANQRIFDKFIPLFLLYALNLYLLVSTGISFFQGDRLTISTLAIWTVIYPLFLFTIGKTITQAFNKAQNRARAPLA